MGNFTGSMQAGLSTSDGISLSKNSNGVALNAKVLLDDTFGPGPVVVDLAPLIASIADPKMFLLLCEGDGALIDIDSVGPSTKAFKTLLGEFSSTPTGVGDIEITANGAAQRIRFLCMGD